MLSVSIDQSSTTETLPPCSMHSLQDVLHSDCNQGRQQDQPLMLNKQEYRAGERGVQTPQGLS